MSFFASEAGSPWFGNPIDTSARLPFGIPPTSPFASMFGAPLLHASVARSNAGGAGAEANPPSDPTSSTAQTTDRKEQCVGQCYALTLALPPYLRSGTFEQCLAHCEGRGFWPQFEPFIPFGGKG